MSGVLTSVPAAPVLVPVAVLETALLLVFVRRRSPLTGSRALTVLAATVYTAAVLSLTLLPLQVATGQYRNQAAWTDKIQVVPVVTIDPRTFLLNVALTVPLGVLLPVVRGRIGWRRVAGTVFAASLVVELVQAATNIMLSSGRVADVDDLIANTAGGVLGHALFVLLVRTSDGTTTMARFALTPPRQERVARLEATRPEPIRPRGGGGPNG